MIVISVTSFVVVKLLNVHWKKVFYSTCSIQRTEVAASITSIDTIEVLNKTRANNNMYYS